MAIIKMKPPKCGKMIGLKFLLDYIMNDAKTDDTLIFAQNCNANTAYDEMVLTKVDWNKTDGRQYCHIIQSFDPKQNITPELAHEIGKRMIQEFPQFEGFEIVMSTHKNKSHLHNHIAINSVNSVTGLKWEQRANDLIRLKQFSNMLCEEYGLTQIEFNNKKKNQSYGEWRNRKANSSWKRELEQDIRVCLNNCTSREEFFHAIKVYGYSVTWTNERKYVTFTHTSGKKCRNSKLSNPDYFSKENMQGILDRNYNHKMFEDNKYHWHYAENFSEFASALNGFCENDFPVPIFVDMPCLDGLSQVEKQIAMAQYIWLMESLAANKEYESRRDEIGDYIQTLTGVLELMCDYDFENLEIEIPHYENYDDEEDWEL